MGERQDTYQVVTDRVIAALEAGTVPWHRPWDASVGLPRSLSTGRPYRGVNIFLLALSGLAAGYASPLWGTYKRIKERHGQVRKGERGTLVILWKPIVTKDRDTGEDKKIFLLRGYTVFNAEQADWEEGHEPAVKGPVLTEHERIEAAEEIAKGYPNPPHISEHDSQAFYVPATDTVSLPPLIAFDGPGEYYSTKFHELIHSTGHTSRLNRAGVTKGEFGVFGSTTYSKEELVAELGAVILLGTAGIDQPEIFKNNAAYIQHWLSVLREDNKILISAAAQAQKAADHILGTKFESPKEDS